MRAAAAGLVVFLLVGCLADGPPTLQARNETIEVPESPNYPGLSVRGTLDAQDDRLTIAAVARNTGNRTYQVETGCGTPWSVELFRGEERLELREPQVRCLAFSLTQFGPGAQATFETAWDGTVWNADQERQVEATPGDYVWSVRFVAYHPDGAQLKRFDLDFNVTVS
ncbi:MAG: hypothetical protein AABY18_03445 [Candidatus Thermoplasmatota archaeon]